MAERTPHDGSSDTRSAHARISQQHRWVDLQIQEAIARGDFDNLPGAGRPIPGLGDAHDPDWWLKKLVERERISVLPPAIALRAEDAALDDEIDRQSTERGVRSLVEDFNRRVIDARRQLLGGPPVVTRTRDADHEVEQWRVRFRARREAAVEAARARTASPPEPTHGRRRWWRR